MSVLLGPPAALMDTGTMAFSRQFQVPPLERPETQACEDLFRTRRCAWLRRTVDIETEWPHGKVGTLRGTERLSLNMPPRRALAAVTSGMTTSVHECFVARYGSLSPKLLADKQLS